VEATNCFLALMHDFPTVAYYKRAIYPWTKYSVTTVKGL